MNSFHFIEPLDVLYLRGNKLFGDPGSYGESMIPPWPSVAAGAPLPSTEAQTLANDIKAQEGELAHIRQRKDEVQKLATDAEKKRERFKVRDDQYDLSEALISIAVTLLAVCALAKARWLYWFALLPAAGGLFWGITAMAELPFYAKALFAWLG